jgi:transposase
MKKLVIKDADIMRIAIQQEIEISDNARYNHRLHGILMICNGYSCTDVAKLFGQNRRTIQEWVNRFQNHGFSGLEDRERSGRPPRLTDAMCTKLGTALRKSPRDFGYTQNLWDGKLLSHHILAQYNVHLSVRQCQKLFTKLGFRRRKPRPMIAHGDPIVQRAYKKNSNDMPAIQA